MEMEIEQNVVIDVEDNIDVECCHGKSSFFAKAHRPVTLKFEDVVYKIKIKSKTSKHKQDEERTILKGISGVVLPGEMLAMLGPSGGGKTTLLTILGGRLGPSNNRLTGKITYNGQPFNSSLKRNLGFVTQDDVLYPNLTVTETLVYTALLRLPQKFSRKEKVEQAEAVMEQLGLLTCRNSIIGGPLIRGVSGGERKRVSIGQEMLINPSLLLLDEPTSGLDSTTAGKIVSTLWDLSKGGRTVVMTIHQPSSSIFYMFHKVLLLSDGNPVYFGKGCDAMAYFASVGYAPNVPMNPADFLLDLANGISSTEGTEENISTKEALFSAYILHLHGQVIDELARTSKHLNDLEPEQKETDKWATSWWVQFRVLLERDLKERRHESFSVFKISQVLATALFSGFLWLHSGGHVQDQVGLLFFVAGFLGFFPLFNAIFTFPEERLILTKERLSGMYRLSSYYIARTVSDLPMELILPTIFIVITYWMGGLKRSAVSFFMSLGIMLMHVLVAQGLGLALGALVMNLKAATTLASVIMLSFQLAAGFYVQNVPPFIAWIKYVSPGYYNFKLQIATQYSPDDTYECAPDLRCSINDYPAIKLVGFNHLALDVLILLLMIFLYRLVAYLGLTRIGVAQ